MALYRSFPHSGPLPFSGADAGFGHCMSRRRPATVFLQKCARWHLPAVHLTRNPCESVPGVLSPCPPGTESLQKRSRCHFLPSTCHGIPAKAFQVSFSAFHLPRNSCKSVPGVIFCLPPATEFLQKRSRCHFLPSTWHGIPAKVFQVSFPAVHLLRNHHKSVPGGISCCPPGTASLPMFWRQFEQNTLYCHHDGRLSCIWKMEATEWKSPNGSNRIRHPRRRLQCSSTTLLRCGMTGEATAAGS